VGLDSAGSLGKALVDGRGPTGAGQIVSRRASNPGGGGMY
jgi:hypothetical protein